MTQTEQVGLNRTGIQMSPLDSRAMQDFEGDAPDAFFDDEARHFLTVAHAIETLGGDATSQTPSANLVGVESMGLVQVVNDPRTTIAQSLHALLTAELADQVGWEALIALAEEHEQLDMVSEFTIALDEERGHLLMVQSWYEEAIGIPGVREIDDDNEMEELPP